jgi:hypothetical protein
MRHRRVFFGSYAVMSLHSQGVCRHRFFLRGWSARIHLRQGNIPSALRSPTSATLVPHEA